MEVNREFQHDILLYLKDCYFVRSIRGGELEKKFGVEVHPHLFYLQEHGLISASTITSSETPCKRMDSVELTAKGLDFLADDGGLSAILNIVTVRLDQTQFKELLVKQIEESELPKEQQSMLKRIIQETKREGISKIATELVTYSFNHTPHLLNFLHKLLTTPAV